jgi:sugar lactone lactonase YvrE
MSRVTPLRSRIAAHLTAALLTTVIAATALAAPPPVKVLTLAPELDGAVGGVAVDALGYVYVADFGEKVWKVDPFGKVEVLAHSMYGASGNAIDQDGNLLQSSFYGNFISRITRDGTVTTFASGLSGPVGVTVAPDGTVFACNCRSNVISRISPKGELADFAKGDLFNCPNGITMDGDGNVYVVNFNDGRMMKITPEGKASVFATIPGGGNGHVVFVGPELYVTGFRSNRIYRVSDKGEVTPIAGDGRFGEKDGTGLETQFSSPNGIAYDRVRDVLYTNDHLVPFPVRFQFSTPATSTLRKIVFPSLYETAAAAFEESRDEGKRAILAYQKSRPARVNQLTINGLGYQFLQAGKTTEAIAVFEVATGLFPGDFNLWDSLGEAHKAAGNRDEAIRHYRKSLELNPANANAKAMLKELGGD